MRLFLTLRVLKRKGFRLLGGGTMKKVVMLFSLKPVKISYIQNIRGKLTRTERQQHIHRSAYYITDIGNTAIKKEKGMLV
jgi:hypothetical protein